LLNPLYIAVSWVLLQWHRLFNWLGLDPDSGVTWALSIVLLVVTIRILLFRFFIKQVHSQRKMQEVQPKIAAVREKYKNDRQTLSQEMMKLQKEEGFNPLGGCLPILLQAPVFLALFHVLRLVGSDKAGALSAEYHWSAEQATSAGQATLFGAPIASAFNDPRNLAEDIVGASLTATRAVAFTLIILMVAATYITQRQIIARNTQVLDAQQAMIQKLLLYGMPASLLVSGFFFPIGVLLYWFTNNLWTMGQQFYILKRMPHPNAKKEEDKPAIDPKLLAPKPGQKPVRPRKGAAGGAAAGGTATGGTGGTSAGDSGSAGTGAGDTAAGTGGAAAAPSPDGKAGRAAGDGTPTKRKRGAAAAASSTGGAADDAPPPNGKAPGDAAGDGTAPVADADADADGAAGEKPAPPSPRPKSGGASARPGGARRPQGQRSPTQTRQKKKRR
jgi:YidC/Oxa1 family membrane protein insertase